MAEERAPHSFPRSLAMPKGRPLENQSEIGKLLQARSYDHRRTWIRDRLESLAGLFGVEIAAFAVMCA